MVSFHAVMTANVCCHAVSNLSRLFTETELTIDLEFKEVRCWDWRKPGISSWRTESKMLRAMMKGWPLGISREERKIQDAKTEQPSSTQDFT